MDRWMKMICDSFQTHETTVELLQKAYRLGQEEMFEQLLQEYHMFTQRELELLIEQIRNGGRYFGL